MTHNISIGISDFSEIIENNYYYIDKTGLICELLGSNPVKVTLITRPRRFGKTLAMNMLYNFFNVQKDSKKLFKGLEISKNLELCSNWMNQYPTIFLSLKDVFGLTFESAYGQLQAEFAELFKMHNYLLECKEIDSEDKRIFSQIKSGQADNVQISRALVTLMKMMYIYHHKPVILLLDEYDVPIAKASENNYYKEMLEVIKIVMSTALKDNTYLKFAVITGCLKIAKESIFTGTNNFVSDTINDSRLNEYFGFKQNEVEQLFEDFDKKEYLDEVKAWYNGYHFGDIDIYCPWDVMNYLRDICSNPKSKPKCYWNNTSDNAIIRSFIDYAGSSITKKLETLLLGKCIYQVVDENLTYDYIHSSEDNLWSILYLTGYLTKARSEENSEEVSALVIPNAEIKEIFRTTIKRWFIDSSKTWNRTILFDAVWNGDCEAITREMTQLLRKTISYHDYQEDFYHAFLAGIFAGAGYIVESNKEHGEGRSDVVVIDSYSGRVAVFEAKYSKTLEKLENDCNRALKQMDEKMYAEDFKDDYDEVLCYGISFFKKRCIVKNKI